MYNLYKDFKIVCHILKNMIFDFNNVNHIHYEIIDAKGNRRPYCKCGYLFKEALASSFTKQENKEEK